MTLHFNAIIIFFFNGYIAYVRQIKQMKLCHIVYHYKYKMWMYYDNIIIIIAINISFSFSEVKKEAIKNLFRPTEALFDGLYVLIWREDTMNLMAICAS